MKLALLFLSTFLVISQQQFQQNQQQGGLVWWSPYAQQKSYFIDDNQQAQQPFFQHQQPRPSSFNDYEPFYYDYARLQQINANPFVSSPYLHRYKPNYFQNEEQNINAMETHEDMDENGFEDTQSRIKGFGGKRPSFLNQRQNLSPRFFYSLLNGNSLANPLLKTVTFTSTSTVTVATVQSCLSSSLFVTGSSNVSCRRRRQAEDEDSDEDFPFSIDPSKVEPVTPTEVPSLSQQNQLSADDVARHDLVSSQDEDILSDKPTSLYPAENTRTGRFFPFYKYVYFSTVTSYSFVSTTITKAVNLVSAFFASSALICMPQGYVLCT